MDGVTIPVLLLSLFALCLCLVLIRLVYVLHDIRSGSVSIVGNSISSLIVLGSGGHTGEMLKLTAGLDPARYHPLVYVVADTDKLSVQKLQARLAAPSIEGGDQKKLSHRDGLCDDKEADNKNAACGEAVRYDTDDGYSDDIKSSKESEFVSNRVEANDPIVHCTITKERIYNFKNKLQSDDNQEMRYGLRSRTNIDKHEIGSNTIPKLFKEKITTVERKENSILKQASTAPKFLVERIPRSREVGQSYLTSVYTTLWAILFATKVVLRHKPDLILVNGPGSCVPICFAGFFFRLLGICAPRITFVESLCRVRNMSLTGKILYYFADDIIVQWPLLKDKYRRSKYLGRLV